MALRSKKRIWRLFSKIRIKINRVEIYPILHVISLMLIIIIWFYSFSKSFLSLWTKPVLPVTRRPLLLEARRPGFRLWACMLLYTERGISISTFSCSLSFVSLSHCIITIFSSFSGCLFRTFRWVLVEIARIGEPLGFFKLKSKLLPNFTKFL